MNDGTCHNWISSIRTKVAVDVAFAIVTPGSGGVAMPPQQGPLRLTEMRQQIQSAFNLYTVDRDNSSWEIQRQQQVEPHPGSGCPSRRK